MAERGQITIEGILLMGFFILIFIGVSFPAAIKVYRASNEASIILEARANLDKIANTIVTVRAGGPGSIKTVTVKSSSSNWSLSAYDDDNPNGDVLTYWTQWSSASDVPTELIRNGVYGGIGKNSIEGISTTGTKSSTGLLEAGTYSVKVKNEATSHLPRLNISKSGSTIIITLTG